MISGESNPKGPSRAEVERYCVLSIVGDGCAVADLTARLGLSRELAAAVGAMLRDLQRSGFVDEVDTRVTLTLTGRDWMQRFAEHHGAR